MSVDAITGSQANSASTNARTTLSSNFDTFLTLLTAQLSNQDPLNPVDSAQFTQQLVQYSQVEQQIQTNDRLASLLAQSSASSGAAAVAYIGKTAVIDSPVAALKNDSATWTYATPNANGVVALSVTDASGREVFRTTRNASANAQEFSWNGRDVAGAKLPSGAYTLNVAATDSAGAAVTPAISVNEAVTGIDFTGASPQLLTAAGERAFTSILKIHD